MSTTSISRRGVLAGGAAAAGISVLQISGPAQALGSGSADSVPWLRQHGDPPETYPGDPNEQILWWEDQPGAVPAWQRGRQPAGLAAAQLLADACPQLLLRQSLWPPTSLDHSTWRLDIGGLVAHPRSLTLADLKARPRQEVDFTLECSGNHGFDFFIGGVGNAVWGGRSWHRCWSGPTAGVRRGSGLLGDRQRDRDDPRQPRNVESGHTGTGTPDGSRWH